MAAGGRSGRGRRFATAPNIAPVTLRRAARGLPFALRPAVTPFANNRKRRALGLTARETRLVMRKHSELVNEVISSKSRSLS